MASLKITQLHKQEFKDLQSSKLVLELSGKNVNKSIVNSLRRVVMLYVPTFAFHRDTIEIEENTSIYNNDEMRLRLSQFPYPNVPSKIAYLDEKYWKDINYKDPHRERHPKEIDINMYVNYMNNTDEIVSVTTNHAKFYEDDVEIKNKYDTKYPDLIIKLKPNQSFICKCTAVLNIGLTHDAFSSVSNAYFEEDKNVFILTLESQGQIDEYDALYKGCNIIVHKLKNLKKVLTDDYGDETNKKLDIILENEEFTITAPLNEILQDHNNVVFSGLAKPDLLKDEIRIRLETKIKPITVINECIDDLIKTYNLILKEISRLGKKYIN
jgi:DNA-directed RNA polymerase alpha subunit